MKRMVLCATVLVLFIVGCDLSSDNASTEDPMPLWAGWYKYSTYISGTLSATYIEYGYGGESMNLPLRGGTEDEEYSSEYLEIVSDSLDFYFLRDNATSSSSFEYLEYKYYLLPEWAKPVDND